MNIPNNRRSQNSVENIIRAVFMIMDTEKSPWEGSPSGRSASRQA